MSKVVKRIKEYNQGRDADLLKRKYKAMQADSFTFFRGTCHLFYQDWPADSSLNKAPITWICGDLHLENFGSFKGDNRLVYFDLNDFDEAVLAPCTWDVARFLTSILLAADTLKVGKQQATGLTKSALAAYVKALEIGHVYSVERDTAGGLVKDLLVGLQQSNREDFLNLKSNIVDGRRQIKIDNKRAQIATYDEKDKVIKIVNAIALEQAKPEFFQVLDVAHRIAGTGSLGLDRYIILIEGKGSPDKNYLLDLKAEPGSSLAPYLKIPQPEWSSEAKRCVTVQKRIQNISPALLFPVKHGDTSYILRELQPKEDRVNLAQWNGDISLLQEFVETLAKLAAWAHLRGAGRRGADSPDALIDFTQVQAWQGEIIDYAQAYYEQVKKDYKDFCDSHA